MANWYIRTGGMTKEDAIEECGPDELLVFNEGVWWVPTYAEERPD